MNMNKYEYKKYEYGCLGRWYIKSTPSKRFLLKQNFQKNKAGIG